MTDVTEQMSLAVALDFAENPRQHDTLQAPADSEDELREALKVLAAAYRDAARTPADVGEVERGFDAAVNAIEEWAQGMYSDSTKERLWAVASDLVSNKATILAATVSDTGPKETT